MPCCAQVSVASAFGFVGDIFGNSGSTFTLSSADFACCSLAERSNSYGVAPFGSITPAGAMTIVLPGQANQGSATATFQIVDCPVEVRACMLAPRSRSCCPHACPCAAVCVFTAWLPHVTPQCDPATVGTACCDPATNRTRCAGTVCR
jgi:hypothetical protein